MCLVNLQEQRLQLFLQPPCAASGRSQGSAQQSSSRETGISPMSSIECYELVLQQMTPGQYLSTATKVCTTHDVMASQLSCHISCAMLPPGQQPVQCTLTCRLTCAM